MHAGWGAAVFVSRNGVETEWLRLYGPVVLNPHSCNLIGAHSATNNTGELSAIINALIWVNQEAPDNFGHGLETVYGSKCAAAALQGVYNTTKEPVLIDTGIHVLSVTAAHVAVSWRWVKGP